MSEKRVSSAWWTCSLIKATQIETIYSNSTLVQQNHPIGV